VLSSLGIPSTNDGKKRANGPREISGFPSNPDSASSCRVFRRRQSTTPKADHPQWLQAESRSPESHKHTKFHFD
jgi:hypothetical protein